MTDQNLRLASRHSHRGIFFTGAGVLCAVAVTLAGCSGLSKNKDSLAATSQTGQVETGRARFAKSERARKAAVKKLAVALATNKTLKKQLLGAKNSAEKFREEAQAADRDIADLEAELVKAKAEPTEAQEMLAAVSLEVKEVRAENEKLTRQVQAAQAKVRSTSDSNRIVHMLYRQSVKERAQVEQVAQARITSASDSNRIVHVLYRQSVKERAQVEQAAAQQAEALRSQLATAKRKTSEAQDEAKAALTELAAANAEIARLKAVTVEKPISSAAQQSAQPQ